MNVTWLGQSGYLLEGGGRRLALDPYLSDIVEREQGLRRLVPPPCSIASLAPDALLITHDHLDHYDPETVAAILSAFPACRLAGPASVMAHAARDGIAAVRLVPLDVGAAVRLGDVEITATPAHHSDASAVGLLIRAEDARLWFSGDTLYTPEMSERILQLAGRAPDAAFVCMNGRLGNMGIDDAVRLLAEIRPAVAVPSHYGMFAENTADPAAFVAACARAGLRALVMDPGRPRAFPGGDDDIHDGS
ncbi:MAG: hypothetical protein BWK77_05320 [Verrucomicrobia bacterium A1]|nr:MAG: hypothetical protein BWK77_05320 [Verrucomicrobia bacterium A1]